MHNNSAGDRKLSEQNRKMADMCFKEKNYEEALHLYGLSLESYPNNVKSLNNLAVLSEELGEYNKAEKLYKQACKQSETIPTDKLKYLQNLAALQERNENFNAALWTYQSAANIQGFVEHRIALKYFNLLQRVHIPVFDSGIFSNLKLLLSVTDVDKDAAAHLYLCQLAFKLKSSSEQKYKNINKTLEIIETDPLTLTILSNHLITNHTIENLILDIRKHLIRALSSDSYAETHTAFLTALTNQCILNGFIYSAANEELTDLENLKSKLPKLPSIVQMDAKKIISSYTKKNHIRIFNRILLNNSKTHQNSTSTLKPPKQKDLIRTFYKFHPYPVWTSKPQSSPSTLTEYFRRLNLSPPPVKKERILVAGCGTGRHAIQLCLTYPHADIIGLDISEKSLEYANLKKNEYELKNLEFVHGDLNDIDSLGVKFSLIECIGVLHHLQNPSKGGQSIISSLCEGGIAKIGLYSTFARAPIKELAGLAAEKNILYIPDNLEKIRTLAINSRHYGRIGEIVNSPDFYSRHGCMDLLFNPSETTFTPDEIHKFTQTLKCEFSGFERAGQEGSPNFRHFGSHSNTEDFFKFWSVFEHSNPNFFSEMYLFWLKPKREQS